MKSNRSLNAEPNWHSYSGVKILPDFCKETYVEFRILMKSANLNCRTILTFIMIAQDTKQKWEKALERARETSSPSTEAVEDILETSSEFSFIKSSELSPDISVIASPMAKKRKLETNFQNHDSATRKEHEALLVMNQKEDKNDESSMWSDDEVNCLMSVSLSNNECFHEIENDKDEKVNHFLTGYDEDFTATTSSKKCSACNSNIDQCLDESSLSFMDGDQVNLSYFKDEKWKQTAHHNIPCFWHDMFGCEDCYQNSFSGTHLCELGEAVMSFKYDNCICENCLYYLAKKIDKGWWDDSWDVDSFSEKIFPLPKNERLNKSFP